MTRWTAFHEAAEFAFCNLDLLCQFVRSCTERAAVVVSLKSNVTHEGQLKVQLAFLCRGLLLLSTTLQSAESSDPQIHLTWDRLLVLRREFQGELHCDVSTAIHLSFRHKGKPFIHFIRSADEKDRIKFTMRKLMNFVKDNIEFIIAQHPSRRFLCHVCLC